jgi:hypothetical protein
LHGIAAGGSRVVVFDLTARGGSPRGSSLVNQVHLTYRRSVTSPLFQHLPPSDLVEGYRGGSSGFYEVFVTQWLQYPAPAASKHRPRGRREGLRHAGQELVIIGLLRRCVLCYGVLIADIVSLAHV